MFREDFVVIGQLWRTSMIVSPPAAEGVSMGFLTSSAPLPPPERNVRLSALEVR